MTMTIGARIKALREQRKLSQEALSEQFGFKDRQTLSAIETGERKVAAEELLRAVQIFGVSLEFFTDPFLLAGEGQFSWRQMGVDGDKLRGYEESAGRFIALFRTLGRQVGQEPPLFRRALSLTKQSSFDDVTNVAERFAAELELGDVPAKRLADVMAERLGILVLMVDPIEGVSGAACQLPELDVVLINRNEVAGRRNFDLAHELFHILTWEKMPPEHIEEVAPKKRSRVEQLADNFASALLMPSAALDRFGDWSNLVGSPLTDRLNAVADELLVTSLALKWRLFNAGRLTRGQVIVVDDEALRNNGHDKPPKQEPPALFSRPFVQVLATALEEGKTSMRRAASILDVPIDDFASLFGAHGVEAPYELCDSYRRVEAGRAALAQLAASGNGYIAQIGPNAAADTLPGGYLAGIWGGDDGVYLDDIGGSVNVMNGAGIIVGLADDGVSASNVGGHFELSNSGTDQNPTLGGIVAGGEAGVRLRGIGDGVDIFNGVGTIYGESDGIDARYVTGDLLVSNDAGGLIQGLYGDGIRIRDADKVTITNNGGDIFGGDRALYVRSSGDVVINNWGGNIVGDGSWDEAVIRLRSNDSSTVNNSGIIASFATPHSTETWSLPTVDGNDADAWAAFDLSKGAGWTFDAAAIWDDFNVLEGFISGAGTGADGMVAYSGAAADMAIRSSDDTTTINNKAGGILIGRVNLDGSWSGDGSKIVNDGIWITRGTSEVHGTTGDDTITNNAAALIIAAVDGTKNATTTFESDVFTNNGLISMADGGVGDRVYIRGDSYVGGGTVFVDANLNNGSLGSDQFRVRTDEISGTTAIAVRLVDRGGHVDDRVEVANYNGAGTVAADAYVLSSDSDNYISIGGTGYIEDGLVAWSLQADSWNGHDLVAGWGPGALSSAGVITGAQNIFYDPVSIVEDHSYGGQFARSGGGGADLVLPEPAAPGSASDVAVWVKGSGSLTTRDTTVTVNAVPFNTGFDQRIFSLIGGADVTPHGGVFRAGAFGGVVGSAIDFNLPGASAEYMGGTVGAYGAYNDGALFADVTAKADLLAVTYNYAGTSVDAASTSIGVLGNVGYRVALGNGVFVEPIASGAVVGTQITDVGGINFQDALSIRGGVGAKIGTNVPLESYNAEIALLGRVWNEFGGPNSTVVTDGVNTLTVNDNSGGLYGELVGTATVKNLEGNMSGFTSVGATFSANSLSFGGKAGLRVGF